MYGLPSWVSGMGNTDHGLFVVDRAQRILEWNRAAERLLGYAAPEVVGRPCHDIIDARDRSGDCCCGPSCRVLLETGRGCPVPDFDARVRTKSGAEVWLTFIVLPLALPGNPLTIHLFHPVRHRDYSEPQRPAEASTSPPVVWSPRERAILGCLMRGATTGEIASELGISPLTVRTHIRNMLAKAGLRSRVQLVSLGVRGGNRS